MTSASEFVSFHITVCGVAELAGHSAVGVSHVLSILDPDFPDPEAFGAFGEHERLDLRFHDITEARRRDAAGGARGRGGAAAVRPRSPGCEPEAHLLVHCHMGISRSTASMALILAQARPDRPALEVLAEVRRDPAAQIWPNLRIIELGDELLGRGGELVAAAVARYRQSLDRRRASAVMVEMGRGRECERRRHAGLSAFGPQVAVISHSRGARETPDAHRRRSRRRGSSRPRRRGSSPESRLTVKPSAGSASRLCSFSRWQ